MHLCFGLKLHCAVWSIPVLSWMSKSKNPPVSGMTVVRCGYWLDNRCLALLCVSLCPLVPCGNNAQLGGGSDAERVRSTLA